MFRLDWCYVLPDNVTDHFLVFLPGWCECVPVTDADSVRCSACCPLRRVGCCHIFVNQIMGYHAKVTVAVAIIDKHLFDASQFSIDKRPGGAMNRL